MLGMRRDGGVDEGAGHRDHLARTGSLTFPAEEAQARRGALDLRVGGGRFTLELS